MKSHEKIAKKVVQKIVNKEATDWPPTCMGIFYQPERPRNKTTEKPKK